MENSEKNTEQEAFFKKKKKKSAVPALFFHTMLIIFEYIVQMVGCIFAEGFFQAKFIDVILNL